MEREKTPVVRDLKVGARVTYKIFSKTFEPLAEIAKRDAMFKLGEILYGGRR